MPMLTFRQRPDTRVLLALIVALFFAAMAVWWALRAGRVQSATAPTPVPPAAPGPPGAAGAPGTAPALPTPP